MKYLCLGVNGFAGDRSSEAMDECHSFTTALASFLDIPVELYGSPQQSMDLPWHHALTESKATFSTVTQVIKQSIAKNYIPILITPRCASAIVSLPLIISEFPDVVILYFDAHGDLNTPETSTSSYLGGMPLTAVMGEWDSGYGGGLDAKNLVHIGGRDLDKAEHEFIIRNDIMTLSKELIESDIGKLASLIQGKTVYIHIDTDVYDPSEVVAEYSVEGGLFRGHVDKVLSLVQSEGKLVGLEITELSPKNNEERKRSYEALFASLSSLVA